MHKRRLRRWMLTLDTIPSSNRTPTVRKHRQRRHPLRYTLRPHNSSNIKLRPHLQAASRSRRPNRTLRLSPANSNKDLRRHLRLRRWLRLCISRTAARRLLRCSTARPIKLPLRRQLLMFTRRLRARRQRPSRVHRRRLMAYRPVLLRLRVKCSSNNSSQRLRRLRRKLVNTVHRCSSILVLHRLSSLPPVDSHLLRSVVTRHRA